ncbi:MAG TPA: hypothetical protein VEJ19_09075 [Nitrososphaerales archaeon]|nr:hypothetical protein [Nitrososphaerales archaeon]
MRNRVVASLLVVAVLAAAGAGYLFGVGNEHTYTSTFTSVSTSTLAVSVAGNSSTLLTQCSHAETPTSFALGFGLINSGTTIPAVICVQYYYFSAVPTTLATSMIIKAVQTNRSFSGDSNFTLIASANHLLFGGPQDADEGAVVAYAVTAKPGASGTYEVAFSGDYMLSPSEPEECYYYATLVAGNWSPLYATTNFDPCITYAFTGTTPGNLPSIPGVEYPILTDTLYFRIVGVINSTG